MQATGSLELVGGFSRGNSSYSTNQVRSRATINPERFDQFRSHGPLPSLESHPPIWPRRIPTHSFQPSAFGDASRPVLDSDHGRLEAERFSSPSHARYHEPNPGYMEPDRGLVGISTATASLDIAAPISSIAPQHRSPPYTRPAQIECASSRSVNLPSLRDLHLLSSRRQPSSYAPAFAQDTLPNHQTQVSYAQPSEGSPGPLGGANIRPHGHSIPSDQSFRTS